MKKRKTILSFLLALLLLTSYGVQALAADITIDPNTPAGQDTPTDLVYKAYKIFDAAFEGETLEEDSKVSYTIDSASWAWETIRAHSDLQEEEAAAPPYFHLEQVNDSALYVVTATEAYNTETAAKALAAALESECPESADATAVYDAASETYEMADVEPGYYLITSSLGTALIVDTFSTEEIVTKNSYPGLDKTITAAATIAAEGKSATQHTGNTVEFTIAVDIPATASGEIVVHDTLDEDMSYGGSFTAQVDGAAVTGVTYQSPGEAEGESKCSYEFVIDAATVAAHRGKTVDIVYAVTLLGDAETGEAHSNQAYLTYAEYTSKPVEVEVFTYQADVYKYTMEDGEKQGLGGAGFVLKNSDGAYYRNTDGVITWVKSVEDATEYITDETGAFTVSFTGLANGTYTLVEKTVPAGYNPIDDQEFIIADSNKTGDTATATTQPQIQVENKAGQQLPETGGMGTTVFYTLGSVLMLGALVVLITRKRMSGERD